MDKRERFEEDYAWIQENYEKLIQENGDNIWIAVYKKKVIGVNHDLEALNTWLLGMHDVENPVVEILTSSATKMALPS